MKLTEYTGHSIEISDSVLDVLNNFIDVSNILLEIHQRKKYFSLEQFIEFNKKLQNYNMFSFINPINNQINEVILQINKRDNGLSKRIKYYDKILKYKSIFEKSIKKMDFKSLQGIDITNDFFALQKLLKSNESLTSNIEINFLKSGFSSFFNAGNKVGLLDSFDKDDWKELNKMKFNKPLFNYLEPISYKSSFEEIVYYINHLVDSEQDIELNTEEFMDYVEMIYKTDSNFKKFKNFVNTYLHSNNKKLIKTIITFLNAFPIIKKENDKRKKEIKEVYRGISFSSTEYEELPKEYFDILKGKISGDEYVATSLSKSVAKDFAQGVGGMLTKPSRDELNNIKGLIITYKVDYNSVIIDFGILGSVFGESEVLINAKKAKIINVKEI